jgi:hypothetical protein
MWLLTEVQLWTLHLRDDCRRHAQVVIAQALRTQESETGSVDGSPKRASGGSLQDDDRARVADLEVAVAALLARNGSGTAGGPSSSAKRALRLGSGELRSEDLDGILARLVRYLVLFWHPHATVLSARHATDPLSL